MANTTLKRKAGNDMKKGQGFYQSRNEADQKDKGLGFEGLTNGSSQRNTGSMKYSGNHHTGVSNEGHLIQEAQLHNTKGNLGKTAGPVTANKGKTSFSNPDAINVGNGPREHDGTRKWEPKREKNYVGNPDRIEERQLHNSKGNLKG